MAVSTADGSHSRIDMARQLGERMGIIRETRLIGGAMIVMLLVAVVLNEVFSAVDVGSGPFSGVGTDLETTGVAAIGLLVVGLIIVAANAIMQRFGGGM
jgi:hydrogenase-4 membrane subunit HyfE